MPDPVLRDLLERGRPVRDFAQALQTSFRLIELAISAEATLENAIVRAHNATQEAQVLEEQKNRLAEDLAGQREALLIPVRQEVTRLEGEAAAVRKRVEDEKRALDEERGRRTSILRILDEQITDARRTTEHQLLAVRATTKTEEDKLKGDLARLGAQIGEAKRELDQLRAEYRGVQEAAAKLAGRR